MCEQFGLLDALCFITAEPQEMMEQRFTDRQLPTNTSSITVETHQGISEILTQCKIRCYVIPHEDVPPLASPLFPYENDELFPQLENRPGLLYSTPFAFSVIQKQGDQYFAIPNLQTPTTYVPVRHIYIRDRLRRGNKVDFCLTRIGDEGARIVAEELVRPGCTITDLNLFGNNINSNGAKAIADALKTNKSVTALNLEKNQFQLEGVKAIAKALAKNATLHIFNMNELNADECQEILNGIRQNRSLLKIEIHPQLNANFHVSKFDGFTTRNRFYQIHDVNSPLLRTLLNNYGVERPVCDGQTLLHLAAHHENESIFQKIMKLKPKVNQQDDFGNTAMHLTCDLAIARGLIEYTDLGLKNNAGHLPYHRLLSKIPILFHSSPSSIAQYITHTDESQVIFPELRVLMIGSGGAGKTTLIKLFRAQSSMWFPSLPSVKSNVAIEIDSISRDDVTLTFWDIAGQEEYTFAQSFCMSYRVLVVYVCDLTREYEELRDDAKTWFEFVWTRNAETRCVIVGTHLDRVSEKEAQDKLTSVVDEIKSIRSNFKLIDPPPLPSVEQPLPRKSSFLSRFSLSAPCMNFFVPPSWLIGIFTANNLRRYTKDIVSEQSVILIDELFKFAKQVSGELLVPKFYVNVFNAITQIASVQNPSELFITHVELSAQLSAICESSQMDGALEVLNSLGKIVWRRGSDKVFLQPQWFVWLMSALTASQRYLKANPSTANEEELRKFLDLRSLKSLSPGDQEQLKKGIVTQSIAQSVFKRILTQYPNTHANTNITADHFLEILVQSGTAACYPKDKSWLLPCLFQDYSQMLEPPDPQAWQRLDLPWTFFPIFAFHQLIVNLINTLRHTGRPKIFVKTAHFTCTNIRGEVSEVYLNYKEKYLEIWARDPPNASGHNSIRYDVYNALQEVQKKYPGNQIPFPAPRDDSSHYTYIGWIDLNYGTKETCIVLHQPPVKDMNFLNLADELNRFRSQMRRVWPFNPDEQFQSSLATLELVLKEFQPHYLILSGHGVNVEGGKQSYSFVDHDLNPIRLEPSISSRFLSSLDQKLEAIVLLFCNSFTFGEQLCNDRLVDEKQHHDSALHSVVCFQTPVLDTVTRLFITQFVAGLKHHGSSDNQLLVKKATKYAISHIETVTMTTPDQKVTNLYKFGLNPEDCTQPEEVMCKTCHKTNGVCERILTYPETCKQRQLKSREWLYRDRNFRLGAGKIRLVSIEKNTCVVDNFGIEDVK
eukprot:c10060_g1_i1.p1 GENE.c10060_g1_i1~~c10060_g1_i1.p1  ORF type:complete len:1238 (+),score=224.74 c10060_g1_i1:34-3714(+)